MRAWQNYGRSCKYCDVTPCRHASAELDELRRDNERATAKLTMYEEALRAISSGAPDPSATATDALDRAARG